MSSEPANSDETNKKKGWALLRYDFQQKELILIKFLTFFFQACLGVLIPFMTVHMKSLGISVEETAIIYGVIPFFAILAPGTLGVIADKLGNFRVLLSAAFVLKCGVALSFLAIPTGRFVDTYPVNLSLAVGCSALIDLDSINCDFKPTANLSLKVDQCGYLCLDSQPQEMTDQSLPADWPTPDQPHYKFRNGLFFREDWNIDVNCSTASGNNCTVKRRIGGDQFIFHPVAVKNLSSPGNLLIVDKMAIECDADYDRPIRLIQPIAFKLNNSLKSDQGVLTIGNQQNDSIVYKICRAQCLVRVPRSDICANKEHVVVFDPQLTFWLYMFLRLVFQIFLNGSGNLFEGACLAIVTQIKGDLGVQRIFGLIGLMVFSPISGLLMDHFSIGRSIPDYRPAFYLYAGLVAVLAVGILFIDLNFKSPNSNLFKDVKILLKNVELVVFMVVVFMSGLFMGYIESYLFWFLEEIGGTKSLMGLTITIACLAGIPILLFSDKIFRKIGQPNVQVIGFLVYAIRLLGYSYIEEPYMCLIYEVLESVTSALMLTSMLAYAAQLSTTTTLATVQGLLGAAYWGMGRGAGTFIGGFLMKWLSAGGADKTAGMRATFRVLGVASAVTAVVYFLFNIFYIRRLHSKAQQCDEPQEECQVKEIGVVNPVFLEDHYRRSSNNKAIK